MTVTQVALRQHKATLEQLRDQYLALSAATDAEMEKSVFKEIADAIDNGLHDSSIAWAIKQLEDEE